MIMALLLLTLAAMARAASSSSMAGSTTTASMSAAAGHCREEDATTAAATGSFVDAVSTTGWGLLTVNSSASAAPLDQAFAAGCVEAKLTAQQTHDYWLNYMKEEYHALVPPPKVVAFMEHQQAWLRTQIAAAGNQGDPYWEAMGLVLAQWDGFAQGILQYATMEQRQILTPSSLYLLCSVGDLETINGLVRGDSLPVPSLATEDKLPCSSLISLQMEPGGSVSDIFASQATWRSYYAMLRIYKVYSFDFYPQKVLTIASSPGLLHSKDDFLSSPTLWVAETTNMVSNRTMRQWNVDHSNKSALSWQRSMVASGWAGSGKEWVDFFSRENSGTYNNQWMVLDASRVNIGERLPATGVLWIAEQVPGLVATMDVTAVLAEKGYWPSYNIAYIPEIYAWSGYPANRSAADGYDGAPRAQIFSREAPKVKNWAEFKRLIRLNDFENDPVCAVGCSCIGTDGVCNHSCAFQAKRSGDCAISARGDLPGPRGGAFGGIDAKVLKLSSMHAVLPPQSGRPPQVEAQSGPTHDQQPPFSWSVFPNVSHVGVPEVFDFDWITIG